MDEGKWWVIALAIVAILIISGMKISSNTTIKAFENGYVEMQLQGTTDVYWTKK